MNSAGISAQALIVYTGLLVKDSMGCAMYIHPQAFDHSSLKVET
jgi:hypothetical protein